MLLLLLLCVISSIYIEPTTGILLLYLFCFVTKVSNLFRLLPQNEGSFSLSLVPLGAKKKRDISTQKKKLHANERQGSDDDDDPRNKKTRQT